jgi:RNA polymerase sigma factor (TIGR02999 family)
MKPAQTPLAALIPSLYRRLRGLARAQRRRRRSAATLNTTGLVHEAYVKIASDADLQLSGHDHLLALAARAMRQVLVSRARAHLCDKRGGGAAAVPFEDNHGSRPADAEQRLDLDRQLRLLRQRSALLASVFACRTIGGLSEQETAGALGLPLRTVQRAWHDARAWLRDGLDRTAARGRPTS